MGELKIFYCTFGLSHELSDHVQIVAAENIEQAEKVMNMTYNNNWGFAYSEDEWKKIDRYSIKTYHILDLLDARKVVLSDYVR